MIYTVRQFQYFTICHAEAAVSPKNLGVQREILRKLPLLMNKLCSFRFLRRESGVNYSE